MGGGEPGAALEAPVEGRRPEAGGGGGRRRGVLQPRVWGGGEEEEGVGRRRRRACPPWLSPESLSWPGLSSEILRPSESSRRGRFPSTLAAPPSGESEPTPKGFGRFTAWLVAAGWEGAKLGRPLDTVRLILKVAAGLVQASWASVSSMVTLSWSSMPRRPAPAPSVPAVAPRAGCRGALAGHDGHRAARLWRI